METILNLLPLTDEERAAFVAAAPDADHVFEPVPNLVFDTDTASLAKIARANVILGNVPAHMLVGSTGLRWLQTWSAGTSCYLAPGVLPEGTIVTSAVGVYGQAVSEHMLACLLALMKRLPVYRDNQQAHIWRDEGMVRSLNGATVLQLGTGDLGSNFARLVKPLGARVIGFNRHPEGCLDYFDELHTIDELDRFLPMADVVSMTLPDGPDTDHLMNTERIRLLPGQAIVLNSGGGSTLCRPALASALREGRLWGAALDVLDQEPLPAGHPLWDCPNLILTPHVAAGLHLPQTRENIVSIALENLRHYMAGEPMINRVL